MAYLPQHSQSLGPPKLAHCNSLGWLRLVPLLGLCGIAIACGSAPPVDVGTDYALVQDAEVEVVDPGAGPVPDATRAEFDAFLTRGGERGIVSPYCRSSFQACGGILAGTWVVEDTCNPETNDREVLQRWGVARMELDAPECRNAVQRLTSSWSGVLAFEEGVAIDQRQRAQKVDIELTPTCISATSGIDLESAASPDMCDSLQSSSTTCGASGGLCLCSNRTVVRGDVSGVYGVLGETVAVKNVDTLIYEYCVDGDRLLWREPNTLRYVVLRRTSGAPPPEGDPMETPR